MADWLARLFGRPPAELPEPQRGAEIYRRICLAVIQAKIPNFPERHALLVEQVLAGRDTLSRPHFKSAVRGLPRDELVELLKYFAYGTRVVPQDWWNRNVALKVLLPSLTKPSAAEVELVFSLYRAHERDPSLPGFPALLLNMERNAAESYATPAIRDLAGVIRKKLAHIGSRLARTELEARLDTLIQSGPPHMEAAPMQESSANSGVLTVTPPERQEDGAGTADTAVARFVDKLCQLAQEVKEWTASAEGKAYLARRATISELPKERLLLLREGERLLQKIRAANRREDAMNLERLSRDSVVDPRLGEFLASRSPVDAAWCRRMVEADAAWLEAERNAGWTGKQPPTLAKLTQGFEPGVRLAAYLFTARASKPSRMWLRNARALAEELGADEVQRRLLSFAEASTAPMPLKSSVRWSAVASYRGLRKNVGFYLRSLDSPEDAAALAAFTAMGLGLTGGWLWHDPDNDACEAHGLLYTDPRALSEENEIYLKGAAWALTSWRTAETVRVLRQLAEAMLVKVWSGGPRYRSLKTVNAVIFALGEIATPEAVTAIGRIRMKVRDQRLSAEIGKAMAQAAAQAGMTIDELEDIAVPDFGLDERGECRMEIAGHVASLRVDAVGAVQLGWARAPDGKALKSAPTAVREDAEAKAAWKGLQTAAKEIAAALPVQRARLERTYLTNRDWNLAAWRERLIDHPLVRIVARRLIWSVTEPDGRAVNIMFRDGLLLDRDDTPVSPSPEARVRLWHPLSSEHNEVRVWRALLMRYQIVQPFKQAHREVYPLTEAERTTAIYSNRFAGHLLRQHQYMALAKLRGWSATHRVWADVPNDKPTHILVPAFVLRAEWWIEGAGGDDPEVTDAGAYVFVKSDQVRFRRLTDGGDWCRDGGQGLQTGDFVPLSEVPAIVLSEVMRDIDLFVGVASIGNDPNWADSGREAQHPNQWRRTVGDEYWQRYSFGELNESARHRSEFLAEILPALQIAPLCRIDDRFLVVRGRQRTYRIHIGSGNVLIDGESRYLCIVPEDRPVKGELPGSLFLPFEGDRTLSLILSKAFLLAEDDKIKDPTILRQLAR